MKNKAKALYQNIIIFIILILTAFIIVLSGFRLITSIRDRMKESAMNSLLNFSQVIRETMEDSIQNDLNSLTIISNYIINDEYITTSNINILSSTLGFDWIMAIDENEEGIDDFDGLLNLEEISFYRDWQKETTGYSQPYYNEYRRSEIALWIPIYKDEVYIGTVFAGVVLDKYYSANVFTFYDGAGRTYLFNSQNGTFIMKSLGTDGTTIQQEDIYNLLISSGNTEEDILEFKQAIDNRNSGIAEFNFNGESSYLCFLPIESSNNWYITTVIAENILLKESYDVQRFINLSIVIIILTLAISTLCSMLLIVHRSKLREINYRNSLFSNLSNNLDAAFLFYEKDGKGKTFVSDNVQRLFGIDKMFFETDINNFFDWCKFEKDDPLRIDFIKGILNEVKIYEFTVTDEIGANSIVIKVELIPSNLSQEIIVITDITKDKMTQNSLVEAMHAAEMANKSKNGFLSAMSHDLRTPINGIVGMTTIALANLDSQEKVTDCLHKISDSTANLLNLINEILDMAKIEKGKMELVHEAFNITELFENVLNINYPGVKNKNHTVEVKIDDIKHPNVIGDSLGITRIATNLISNAIKYTPYGGNIKLELQEKPLPIKGYGCYEFIVQDNGIGMSEEFLNKGFEPFERDLDAIESDIQGTGLGMSIVKGLISMMGGTLTVESKKGIGTKFVVTINLELNKKRKEKLTNIPKSLTFNSIRVRSKKIKILMAEDNELNKEIAIEFFKMLDVEVNWAKNGKEAVEMFLKSEKGEYSLIFMDIKMPLMNGYKAAQNIRNSAHPEAKSIPIVAMTADTFKEDIQLALDAGMNEHISKPISIDRLEEVILRFVGGDNNEIMS